MKRLFKDSVKTWEEVEEISVVDGVEIINIQLIESGYIIYFYREEPPVEVKVYSL